MPSYTLCKNCQKRIGKKKKATGYCRKCWYNSVEFRQFLEKNKRKLQEIGKNSFLVKFWNGKKIGKNHQSWKGGKFIGGDGYVYIYFPKHHSIIKSKTKYVLEHRLVMEKHLKRKLKREEVVHHINGKKSDNRIENLVITLTPKHMSKHAKNWKRNKEGKFVASP